MKLLLPAIERVVPRYHMSAAGADQKTDAVIKSLGGGLGGGRPLALDCDGRGVGRAATVGLTLARALSAAVWVHAINQPIWKTGGTVRTGRQSLVDLDELGFDKSTCEHPSLLCRALVHTDDL